jgi:hypothetical protein
MGLGVKHCYTYIIAGSRAEFFADYQSAIASKYVNMEFGPIVPLRKMRGVSLEAMTVP